jgi:hypothetical protein
MRWRIGISSKTARRQSGCKCSTCGSAGGLRCGGRKRRSSLLGRLKCVLYRGGKRLSRAVQRTRRRRPVGGHTPVDLATARGLAEIAAGVLGVLRRRRGSRRQRCRAAGREAHTPRLVGACERQAHGIWEARCAAWPVAKAPPKKKDGGGALRSSCALL